MTAIVETPSRNEYERERKLPAPERKRSVTTSRSSGEVGVRRELFVSLNNLFRLCTGGVASTLVQFFLIEVGRSQCPFSGSFGTSPGRYGAEGKDDETLQELIDPAIADGFRIAEH